MSERVIVAGDIGGTHTRLGLFLVEGNELRKIREERYPSASFPSLEAALARFLEGQPAPLAAALGVPGAVHNGRARATNLPWVIEALSISSKFQIPRVTLLNDLAANALGISRLGSADILELQAGEPGAVGNRCVVSPGTGLGQAGLFWDGSRHQVWACEGGHADFAPLDEEAADLLAWLRRRLRGRVSVERVVSGSGLSNIYAFLRETGRYVETPEVAAEMTANGIGVAVSMFDGRCPLCTATMDIFTRHLAAEAGNFALKAMALGGVYLGGGIPAKILPRLRRPEFLETFCAKGRMESLMRSMPVRVILNDQAALLGAAQAAMELLK